MSKKQCKDAKSALSTKQLPKAPHPRKRSGPVARKRRVPLTHIKDEIPKDAVIDVRELKQSDIDKLWSNVAARLFSVECSVRECSVTSQVFEKRADGSYAMSFDQAPFWVAENAATTYPCLRPHKEAIQARVQQYVDEIRAHTFTQLLHPLNSDLRRLYPANPHDNHPPSMTYTTNYTDWVNLLRSFE